MKKHTPRGFTLIELLVATGVTVIIVSLMVTMVSNLLSAYNRSSGALSAQNQASLVLDQMAIEIESLVLRNSEDVMLAAEVRTSAQTEPPSAMDWSESEKPEADSLRINTVSDPFEYDDDINGNGVPPIETQRFGQGGVWLRYLTAGPSLNPDPDEPTGGVRAVGYSIGFEGVTNAATAPRQYMLYRAEIPAEATFQAGYDLDPDTGNYTTSQVGDEGEANTLIQPTESEIIASNVVDFGVRFYRISEAAATKGQRELVYPLGDSTAELEYLGASIDGEEYPDVVEVMIRVLTPEGERLLAALRNPNVNLGSEVTWWSIVEQHSQVYSRVINIPSSPL